MYSCACCYCFHSLLDEKLLKTIPLVNEANAYSDEIGAGLTFSVKLMTIPGRKPGAAPSVTATQTDDDHDDRPNASLLDTDVFIRVDAAREAGAAAAGPAFMQAASQKFWSYGKFSDRLYNMREMYQVCVCTFVRMADVMLS